MPILWECLLTGLGTLAFNEYNAGSNPVTPTVIFNLRCIMSLRLYREYRGLYRASGPGGIECPCCQPNHGRWNCETKKKLHRTVRRKARQQLHKEHYERLRTEDC